MASLRTLRVRFWVESVLAAITGALAVVTIFWHDWIEAVSGADPDHGNGSAEWLAVAVLAAATVILTAGARREWRRARRAAVTRTA